MRALQRVGAALQVGVLATGFNLCAFSFEVDGEGWTLFPSPARTIHVDFNAGDDANAGGVSSPVRTLSRAVELLLDEDEGAASEIVFSSQYRQENADIFLRDDGREGFPNILNGLIGENGCAVLVDGSVQTNQGGGNADGLSNLVLKDFCASSSGPGASIFRFLGPLSNIYLEGLSLDNIPFDVNGLGELVTTVRVRNSVIRNAYSNEGHIQGIFSQGITNSVVEGNFFFHNGWLVPQQVPGASQQDGGQATMFNHNLYFANASDVLVQNNFFSTPSSINTKFTANPPSTSNEIMSANVSIIGNVYHDAEVMLSAGGNVDWNDGPRFQNYLIRGNLFLEGGRTRPTSRVLSYGVSANDWLGGEISSNTFHAFNPGNGFFIEVVGHTSAVEVHSNLLLHSESDPLGSGGLVKFIGSELRNIDFRSNIVQAPHSDQVLVEVESEQVLQEISFSDNVYYSASQQPFSIGGQRLTWEQWRERTGDTSSFREIESCNPEATLEQYLITHLGQADLEILFAMMPRQLLPALRVEDVIDHFAEALGECASNNCTAACLWLILNRRNQSDP